MSVERELNVAVQLMFRHAKAVVSKNLMSAVRTGAITIDETKLPGLELLVNRSIDEAFVQSAKQFNETFKSAVKSGRLVEHA